MYLLVKDIKLKWIVILTMFIFKNSLAGGYNSRIDFDFIDVNEQQIASLSCDADMYNEVQALNSLVDGKNVVIHQLIVDSKSLLVVLEESSHSVNTELPSIRLDRSRCILKNK